MVATADKPSLKPNVKDLQSDVVDCLEKIVELMGRAKDIFSGDNSGVDGVTSCLKACYKEV